MSLCGIERRHARSAANECTIFYVCGRKTASCITKRNRAQYLLVMFSSGWHFNPTHARVSIHLHKTQ